MMQLDPRASAAGVRLVACDTLESHQCRGAGAGAQGERGPLWITAERQTAGRGRRGRAWVSEPGNLYASLLLTDPAPPSIGAELSFVAALARPRCRGRGRAGRKPASGDQMAERSPARRREARRHPGRGREPRRRRRGRHRRQLRQPSRGDGLSGDRSGGRRRRGRSGGPVRPAVQRDARRGWRNGTAGRASRPSAPTGWRGRRGVAASFGSGSPSGRSWATSRRWMPGAVSCCAASTAAQRPSPPATC